MSGFNTNITPSQVLAGYSKLKNNFLRIDWGSYSESDKGLSRYFNVQVYIKQGSDYTWADAPCMIVKNAISGKMKNYDDRESMSQSGDRPSITFRRNTVYKRDSNKGEERLGEACCAINEAYKFQVEKANKAGLIPFYENRKVHFPVQTHARDKKSDGYVQISNPIIRAQIPFRKDKKTKALSLNCDIYDLRKPISDEEFKRRVEDESDPTQREDVRLERATIDDAPIDVDNIHRFFTACTRITGFIEMSNVCVSKAGVSFPWKMQACIGMPGSGRRHEAGAMFNGMLDALREEANTCEIPEDQLVDSDDEEVTVETTPPEEVLEHGTHNNDDEEDDGVPDDLNDDLKEAEE